MPRLAALPGHLEASPESVEAYTRAFEQMPTHAVASIVARIEVGVGHAERTGDVAPLRHVLDSLLMTARLQNNQSYLLAVAEADAEDARGEHDPVDVGDFVAEMRAKYGS